MRFRTLAKSTDPGRRWWPSIQLLTHFPSHAALGPCWPFVIAGCLASRVVDGPPCHTRHLLCNLQGCNRIQTLQSRPAQFVTCLASCLRLPDGKAGCDGILGLATLWFAGLFARNKSSEALVSLPAANQRTSGQIRTRGTEYGTEYPFQRMMTS